MANIQFDRLENNVISLFLEEMKEIPLVEGVYIKASEDDNYNLSVDVNVVINANNDYNDKIGDFSRDVIDEAKVVLDIIDYYNSYALNGINFSSTNVLTFIGNKTHIAAAVDLVSSEILFDRFGRISNKKRHYEKVLNPYINARTIKNIKNK